MCVTYCPHSPLYTSQSGHIFTSLFKTHNTVWYVILGSHHLSRGLFWFWPVSQLNFPNVLSCLKTRQDLSRKCSAWKDFGLSNKILDYSSLRERVNKLSWVVPRSVVWVEFNWVELRLSVAIIPLNINWIEGWTRLELVFLYPWCYVQALLQKSLISLEVAVDLK